MLGTIFFEENYVTFDGSCWDGLLQLGGFGFGTVNILLLPDLHFLFSQDFIIDLEVLLCELVPRKHDLLCAQSLVSDFLIHDCCGSR